MKITQFLTGVAAAAVLAGTASAYDLMLGNVNATSPDNIEAATTLASELDFSSLTGIVEFYIDQQTEFTFTTDDVIITLTLQNATFNTAFTTADLVADCASGASVVSGGGVGDTQVELLVSGLANCDGSGTGFQTGDSGVPTPGDFGFLPDIAPTGAGSVSFGTNIVTDSGGTPVDGGTASVTAITLQDAFAVNFAADPVIPVADLDVNPIYTEFEAGSPESLGTITVVCDDSVFIDFGGVNTVDCSDTAQLAAATISIAGDFTGLTAGVGLDDEDLDTTVDQALTLDTPEQTASATSAQFLPLAGLGTDGSDALSVLVTADGVDPLQRSSYVATVTLDLGPAFIDEAPFVGALSDIDREGTQVIFPWTPSASQVAGTGATHVVRFANLSDTDARVFIDVLASSVPGFVSSGPVQVDDLPAGGELSYNSAEMEAAIGSNFGRGEVEFTIETTSDNVTARRIAVAADGQFTDLDAGTVEQDQN